MVDSICKSDAREVVRNILQRYSCSKYEETHCSTKELEHDLVRIMDSFMRERDSVQEMHDAWLRINKSIRDEKTFFQRIFG